MVILGMLVLMQFLFSSSMKTNINFISKLNREEREAYLSSELYKAVLKSYQFSESFLNYLNEYNGAEFSDFSLIVFEEDLRPVCVFYAYAKEDYFGFYTEPAVMFQMTEDKAIQDRAFQLIVQKLESIWKENNFRTFEFYENQFLMDWFSNQMKEKQTWNRTYIDLTLDSGLIKANIRKSYKSLINWGERNIEMILVDSRNADSVLFSKFREFHVAVAGKQTRSDRSWDLQFEAILKNQAFACFGFFESQLVSANYILLGAEDAFYGVGVYDRRLMAEKKPIAHYPLYFSIMHAKQIGIKLFNLGVLNRAQNEKEEGINHFKLGFSKTTDVRKSFLVNL